MVTCLSLADMLLYVLHKNLVGRMWCHSRAVYLPMSYIYGKRFVGRITPLVLELRKELYRDPYNEINWDNARNQCAKVCKLTISTIYINLLLHE